jgi:hypothetical protein
VNAILAHLSPRMLALVRKGWTPASRYPSRSEADMAAVRALSRAGASRDEIFAVFERYPIGAKFRERGDDYLARMIEKLAEEPGAETVRVVCVQSRPDRVTLTLRRFCSPCAVATFKQGVSRHSSAWPHFLRAIDVEPGAALRASSTRKRPSEADLVFLGKQLRVRIREHGYDGEPEVTHFLPKENHPW